MFARKIEILIYPRAGGKTHKLKKKQEYYEKKGKKVLFVQGMHLGRLRLNEEYDIILVDDIEFAEQLNFEHKLIPLIEKSELAIFTATDVKRLAKLLTTSRAWRV